MMKKPKYIFITGGVLSSLGKGIASASIGCLLESHGLRITIQKIDPYLNVDPGTMSPYQHGEVYVTDDGAETDLDLGHYERFTTLEARKENNFTAGQIYHSIITKERKGSYLGKTVQVVPHVTNEIKRFMKKVTRQKTLDVVIVELGGTVGDIEGLPFLEAIRQFPIDIGRENCLNIHLTLVPYVKSARELKTKPTQHSVSKLREIGIEPDILLCRTEEALSKEAKKKIALFCSVNKNAVVDAVDVESIYEVPLRFHEQELDKMIINRLKLPAKKQSMRKWKKNLMKLKNTSQTVTIAVVGKYTQLFDSYKSIHEALIHAGIASDSTVKIYRVDTEQIEKTGARRLLKAADGILIPGGFGNRGIEGKITACNFARKQKVPFLGICVGMQCAVIEFARQACGLDTANSSEFAPSTPHPVIDLMPEQKKIKKKGGTMRLGSYPASIKSGTLTHKAYKAAKIEERHRHRYEFNMKYREQFEKAGMVLSGLSPDGKLLEIIEVAKHPWFVGCQFHPEFKSRFGIPHPLFRDFVKAALKRKTK